MIVLGRGRDACTEATGVPASSIGATTTVPEPGQAPRHVRARRGAPPAVVVPPRPTDGAAALRFSERLPRTRLTGGGHTCAECETRLEVFEGPQHPRKYEHAARTIAQTLMLVGTGETHRHAPSVARNVTGWSKHWGQPVKSGSNGTPSPGLAASSSTGPAQSGNNPQPDPLSRWTVGRHVDSPRT